MTKPAPVTTAQLPAAVLWDMDGTIVDTELYWMHAEIELVQEFGGVWDHESALQLVGKGLWESAELFQRAGVQLTTDEIVTRLTEHVRQQLKEHGVPWRPGAQELLREVRSAGVPTALVTMSLRVMADDVAAAIPFDAFDVVITGDSVDNPKPHPEPYLRAAQLLEVNANQCIALEDSPPGVASAIAANMFVIGIPHMVPLDETAAHAIWQTLAGRTAADLFATSGTVGTRSTVVDSSEAQA